MRILVCGSRNWSDAVAIETAIAARSSSPTIIHGGATGADEIAHGLARMHGWPVEVYPADWQQHGKAAGPLRNQKMLDEGKPDVVLAFPVKDSRGTWDMIRRARAAGIPMEIASTPVKDRP
jgi:hypothetical protein